MTPSLVSGDVEGKFQLLFSRVRNVLKKSGEFEVRTMARCHIIQFIAISLLAPLGRLRAQELVSISPRKFPPPNLLLSRCYQPRTRRTKLSQPGVDVASEVIN